MLGTPTGMGDLHLGPVHQGTRGLVAPDFPSRAALSQNHGSITSGGTLAQAVDVELEEVTRLCLLLGGAEPRLLTASGASALAGRYGTPWQHFAPAVAQAK